MTPATLVDERAPERRILDATLRCVGRWGMAKTTLDDVAREAGCSRATVYRVFPGGRDALSAHLVATELERFRTGLSDALAGLDHLDDVLVAGITYAGRFLGHHEALRFLLAYEPELVLPRIAFGEMRRVLRVAAEVGGPHLAPFVGADEAPRAAEWVARLVFSYTLCPGERVRIDDEASVRRLVLDFVLPGLTSQPTIQI